MRASKLTEEVLAGQANPVCMQKAEWAVACWIYSELHRKFQLDADEAGNFFCDFYPKIRRLILQFEFRGCPFEAYLYTTLRWQVLSYKKQLSRQRLDRQLCTYESFWDVHQEEPACSEPIPSKVPYKIHNSFKTYRKRLIYVALRECEYLNNELMEAIVQYTRIDRRWFLNCIMALRRKVELRRHRLDRTRLYYNSCLYRYYLLQLKVYNSHNPDKLSYYRGELDKNRARLHRVSRQLKKMHVHPTNREIAEVLNVPKGSIDSGIFYILEKIPDASLQDPPLHAPRLPARPQRYPRSA